MRFWLVILALGLLPSQGAAGAWPREEGSAFLSLAYTASGDPAMLGTTDFQVDGYSALYMEYGATPSITIGLDAGFGGAESYTAIAFARYSLPLETGQSKYAVEAGVGTTRTGDLAQTLVQIGASWGRGIETPIGAGWVALDSKVQYRTVSADTVAKANLTVGVNRGERAKLMMQLQAGSFPDSDPYLRLAPSIAWQFRQGQHAELGLEADIIGEDDIGLKLGTWLEF